MKWNKKNKYSYIGFGWCINLQLKFEGIWFFKDVKFSNIVDLFILLINLYSGQFYSMIYQWRVVYCDLFPNQTKLS